MAVRLARGDIVLTIFPFTDLSGHSVRPAVVLSQGAIGQDVVIAGISSVIRQPLGSMDVLLDMQHREFGGSGLQVTSVIRVHKLVTVEKSMLVRRLGRIGSEIAKEIDHRLRVLLGL